METRLASAMISHTFDIILSHGNFVAQSFVPTWITTSACESVSIFFSIDSISHVFAPPREFTVRDLGLVDLMSRIMESPTRRVVASFSARSFDSRWLVSLSDFSCAVNVSFDSVRVWTFCCSSVLMLNNLTFISRARVTSKCSWSNLTRSWETSTAVLLQAGQTHQFRSCLASKALIWLMQSSWCHR